MLHQHDMLKTNQIPNVMSSLDNSPTLGNCKNTVCKFSKNPYYIFKQNFCIFYSLYFRLVKNCCVFVVTSNLFLFKYLYYTTDEFCKYKCEKLEEVCQSRVIFRLSLLSLYYTWTYARVHVWF